MKRKGFKYFVLKVCDSKGLADAFLRKCVKRKSLGDILASYWSCNLPRRLSGSVRWKAFSADPWPAVGGSRAKARLPSGRPSRNALRANLAITIEVCIPQVTRDCQGVILGDSFMQLRFRRLLLRVAGRRERSQRSFTMSR